jgi:hypothetical protein
VIGKEEETRLETVPPGTFSFSAFQHFSFYSPRAAWGRQASLLKDIAKRICDLMDDEGD